MKGKILLAEPFTSILSQAASEAWHSPGRENQVFSNATIETTLRGFKKNDLDPLRVKYETTLRGADLTKAEVVHSTYNQILNVSHEDLAEFDYVFLDECHVLATDMSYRSDVITQLLNYLIEFVAKKQTAKTKIIFMTGTPSVESIVIPELMEEQRISHLYQRLIIKKTYQTKPVVHLTHLDTDVSSERVDAVIEKINDYLKQGRKVCHIFNNKVKMDQYIREIQSKLSPEIQVGLFYSGSSGECTNNILMGLLGKYDVILVTSFFLNGINIERDALTEDEIIQGRTSPQKYGLIVDLGQSHTRVNALDTIQALNRFRNRKVQCTVFLQKIFKKLEPEEGKKSRFNIKHAARVLRGINSFNYTMLTGASNPDEVIEVPEEKKDKYFLINQLRRNPIFVSMNDVAKASKKEADREKIMDMMNKNLKIYDDWFFSLEGFYFLAKDAGLTPIIKHSAKKLNLLAMNEEHEAIENAVVEAFLNNDEALEYLSNQLDPEKRILVKASDNITDPESTVAENFVVEELINDRYVVVGDFHSSHERSLNYIIRCHLNFSYWYGSDQATELFRYLMDDNINITPGESTHYTTLMSKYLQSCKIASPRKFSNAFGYLKALDILSSKNIGIDKLVTKTSVSYVIHDTNLVDALMDEWSNTLYDGTIWKINNSESTEKEELKGYYSNKVMMKEFDIKALRESLDQLGVYTPYRLNESGDISRVEQLHITRVLPSDKLMRPHEDFDTESWLAPTPMSSTKYGEIVTKLETTKRSNVLNQLTSLGRYLNPSQNKELQSLKIKARELEFPKLEKEIKNFWMTEVESFPEGKNRAKRDYEEALSIISESRELLYFTFQHSEFRTYYESKVHKRLPSLDALFFTDSDFQLSDLDKVPEIDEFTWMGIYDLILEQLGKSEIPKYDVKYWVAFNDINFPIIARKTKGEFCKAVVDYAYADENEDFLLHSGVPTKDRSKGVYKNTTFARDYLKNTYQERQIKNYNFFNLLIDVKKLEEFKKSSGL